MHYKKKASIQLAAWNKNKNEQRDGKNQLTINCDIGSILRPHTQDTQKSQLCGKMMKYPKSEVKFKQDVKMFGTEDDENKEVLKQRVNGQKRVTYTQLALSIGKIVCPSDKSLKIYSSCKNSNRASRHTNSGNQNENDVFKRTTFKMISLKWQGCQNGKSAKTINNTLKSFRNNKFRQTQDNANYYKGKKQKQIKIRSFYDKQVLKTAGNENTQIKFARKELKKKTKCVRNSRFSLKTQQVPFHILNSQYDSNDAKNDTQLQKSKTVKFIQIGQMADMGKYSKLRSFKWKHWKKSQKNIHYNNTTLANQRNTATKQIEQQYKKIYQQKFRAKQNQLRHLNKLHENLNKFKATQLLIQGFKVEHKKYIDNLFSEFQQSAMNYNKLLDEAKNQNSYEELEESENESKVKLVQAKYQLQYKNI